MRPTLPLHASTVCSPRVRALALVAFASHASTLGGCDLIVSFDRSRVASSADNISQW